MATSLCPAELLDLRGADAVTFAYSQFTTDVSCLDVGDWQWSAWLDARGRVRSFFALLRTQPDHILLWLPLGGAEPMRDALAQFVFRAKVALQTSAWHLHALPATALPDLAGTASPHCAAYANGQVLWIPEPEPRIAWLAPEAGGQNDPHALDAWRRADIAAGLPLLAPTLACEFVPQALALERFDAIRFDKGCYPGQEIAARLHFRGGNKRQLRRLHVDGAAVAPGTRVFDQGGAPAGLILYSARNPDQDSSSALAVLADAHDAQRELTVGDRARARIDA